MGVGVKLNAWEKSAQKGDFSKMPRPFRWEDSANFAHFINGYEITGGINELAQRVRPIIEAARTTGHWQGSAMDLWLCLFFCHRAARHSGSDPDGRELQELDHLCEALEKSLNS